MKTHAETSGHGKLFTKTAKTRKKSYMVCSTTTKELTMSISTLVKGFIHSQ